MDEIHLKIPKVYTFSMPDFREQRNNGLFVKLAPTLNRLLDETAKHFGIKKNNLINYFLFEGIKRCCGRVRKFNNEVIMDFYIPYKKRKRRYY